MISDYLLLTLPSSAVTSPKDYPMFAVVAKFRHRMKCYTVCHKDQFWDLFFSVFSKTTCAVLSGIQIAFSFGLLFVDDAKKYT